jgi:UDP-N-acetylglucosamine 2-epimerase (non-hydrolysing)
VLARLGLEPRSYFLVTLHREENVDVEPRLRAFVDALARLRSEHGLRVVVSVHPRTRRRLEQFVVSVDDGVLLNDPLGLFDFIALEQNAFCVLSDSGTVQEECCVFRVPNVTLRDVTERPETLEVGSNMLTGADPESIMRAVRTVLAAEPTWRIPPEYEVEDVSGTVVRLVLGHTEPRS